MDLNHFTYFDFLLFLPELFLIFITILLLVWGLFITTSHTLFKKSINTALLVLLAETNLLTLILLVNNISKTKTIFYNSLIINDYTTICKIIILVCTIIFLILIHNYTTSFNTDKFEFPILVNLSIFAMLVLISSYDLITFYLSIEMQSLCLYILAAFKKTSRFSTEAGIKYFVLGALSSSLLLFGMSLIYGFSGSTNLADITMYLIGNSNYNIVTPLTLNLGFLFLLIGFLFKLTAVPFHIWSPDVYEGAPLIVTVFFATIPKLTIFSVFVRFIFSIFFELHTIWQPLLFSTATITMLFASFATLYQKKIKRFLAYSSISNVGYMLLSVSTGTLNGLHSFFLYILVYTLTMFALFSLLLSLKKKNKQNLIYLTDLLFLTNIPPLSKILFVALLFSMAGIPPFLGFFSKFYVFFSAIEATYYLPLLVGIISSTTSAFYYTRLIKLINFEKILNTTSNNIQLKTSNVAIATIVAVFLLFFIFSPNFLILKTYQLALLV